MVFHVSISSIILQPIKPPAKTLAEAKLVLDRERPELDPLLPADKPLMRRALAIFVASLGAEHSSTRIVRGNYAHLLESQGRTDEDVRAPLDELRTGEN